MQACSFAFATSGVQIDFSEKNNMLVWRKCIVCATTLLLEMIPIHNWELERGVFRCKMYCSRICRLIRFAANDDEHHNGEEGTWTTLESSIVGRPRIDFILCSLCSHVVSAHASSFLGMGSDHSGSHNLLQLGAAEGTEPKTLLNKTA